MTGLYVLVGVLVTLLVIVGCWLLVKVRTETLIKQLGQIRQQAVQLERARQQLTNSLVAVLLTNKGEVTVSKAVTNRVPGHSIEAGPGKAAGSTTFKAVKTKPG